MKQARRDFLLLGAGATAGIVLTPAPWKLLDDVSIWTQNWSWIPRPPRGEIRTRHTVCTLCPAACGVRARCAGSQPVSVAGVADHPFSAGKLCAIGWGAHQLPYHPDRARPAQPETSRRVAGLLASSKRAVLLDLYPRRAASAIYARLNLTYATLQRQETATAQLASCLSRQPAGFDVARARTVISFGAPVLERWGPILAAWSQESANLRIVQVEAALSRSAALADLWIPARAGTEGALARALLGSMAPDRAAALCGVAPEQVEQAAEWARQGPVLALSAGHLPSEDEHAVVALNRGSAAMVRRSASPVAVPEAVAFESLPDGSVELLLIDHGPLAASPGWTAIARKIAPNGTVVSFSPYRAGDALRADILVPAPAWMETADDAIEPEDAPAPFYTIANALIPRPEGVVDPVELLTGSPGAREREMRARVAAIHQAGKGELFTFASGARTAIKDIRSPDELWEKFTEGACWAGEPGTELNLPEIALAEYAPRPAPPALPPHLLPNAGVLPPLTCKLTQESRLYARSA